MEGRRDEVGCDKASLDRGVLGAGGQWRGKLPGLGARPKPEAATPQRTPPEPHLSSSDTIGGVTDVSIPCLAGLAAARPHKHSAGKRFPCINR